MEIDHFVWEVTCSKIGGLYSLT
ncbi:Hypothetical cytosolic protein [Lacticaseibacillus paracasei]|nr:Hypothetical cytosolic protein [Lacticaseibacillus paracasei]